MKSKKFTFKSPNSVKRDACLKLEYDTVYVRSTELKNEIKPLYKRSIYFIKNKENGQTILRKVKGSNWGNLNEGDVVIDFGSLEDLDKKSAQISNNLTIEPALGIRNQLRYFREHPTEDLRIAYKFFIFGFWLALLSISLGVISILATIFEWKIYS